MDEDTTVEIQRGDPQSMLCLAIAATVPGMSPEDAMLRAHLIMRHKLRQVDVMEDSIVELRAMHRAMTHVDHGHGT
jgi:hypothetical protein